MLNKNIINGWINLYKPTGISSAKIVAKVKHLLNALKVGHAGTLDLEAEGVLPIAIGEATKLVPYIMEAKKDYVFTIKFWAKTDTGDASGKIEKTTDYIPTYNECLAISKKFIGKITQIPPKYSALKIKGIRAYNLARQNQELVIPSRKVTIFDLKLKSYDHKNLTATYYTSCSKGTYIRTLSEDIALSLQSLSFVIKLTRTRVGCFYACDSVSLNIDHLNKKESTIYLKEYIMNTEIVLDDIPVLTINDKVAQRIRQGQLVQFKLADCPLLQLQYNNNLIAIGVLKDNCFKSLRVFNFKN